MIKQKENLVSACLRPSVSRRAILTGLLLLPLNAFWLVQMEMATNQSLKAGGSSGPYPSTFSLFANVVCFLLALTALNAWLKRAWPRWAFSQADLLVIYMILTIGTAITSVDFLDVLYPMLPHPARYATPANGWQALFLRHLPSWFYVADAKAVEGWYEGGENPYIWSRFLPWLIPFLAWGGFIVAMLWVMLCINTLLRRQWTQAEKLSYPVLHLPMEMTDPSGRLYAQKLMWAGFGVAGGVSLLNGLSFLYPGVPHIQVKAFDIGGFFPAKPWNAIGWTPISFYPFAIGLGFLLPADLLFSSWFFYLVWKAERIGSSLLGWSDSSPSFPYINEQCFGGYAGIAALALYASRRSLGRALREAWAGVSDPEGPMSSRAALVGLAGGMAFLIGFFCVAGLSPWVCVAAFAIYFAIALAVTRMRAELGPPAHDLHNGGPDYILTAGLGSGFFWARDLSLLTWFYWFNRAYRSLAMPYQLEGYKLAERKGMSYRTVAVALVLASIVGTASGFWAFYHFGYRVGAEAKMAGHVIGFGWEAFNRLNGWLLSPKGTDAPAVIAILIGVFSVLALNVLKLRFWWWPLHPLGFAVSGSYSMNTIWLPLIISWLVKVCLFRYGGLKAYRQALWFFLGLILGDYTVGCAWPIVGWLLGISAYSYYV
ncbi:MAG: hypothetical protein IT210_14015 [Armatimonadetes bacterium]|nr:hypothetical protein [Armatimonadota bacterium]